MPGESTFVGDIALIETRSKQEHLESSDVFTDSSKSVRSQEAAPEDRELRPASAPQTIALARQTATVALVVEDAKALERMRKHLVASFACVIPVQSVAGVPAAVELSSLDAIIAVRPSRAAALDAFAKLAMLQGRPVTLVVSGDKAFDDAGGVDLRIPLGQRPSEVTAEVLAALAQLGIGDKGA